MKQISGFTVKKTWRLLLSDLNIPPGHVLKLAGLPLDLMRRENPRLELPDFISFWRSLETIVGEDLLVPEIINHLRAESFDPAIFACLCSPNLNIALTRLSQYEHLISPLIMEVKIDTEHTAVSLSFETELKNLPISFFLYKLTFINRIARMATRELITPVTVNLTGPVPDTLDMTGLLGIRPETGESNQIVFSSEDAQRQFLTEDHAMWEFFRQSFDIQQPTDERAEPMTNRLRSVLLEMLPSGEISIDVASSRLAVSTRSLQRKLQEENVSFQSILSSLRKELADYYLESSDMTIAEISYLLAYSDISSFQRAYKVWAGVAPSKARNLVVR